MFSRLEADIKAALLSGDKEKAHALQFMKSVLLTAAKDQGLSLDDETVIKLFRKEVKKRLEAAELFERGGNLTSAVKERSEAELIREYLPEELDDDSIRKVLQKIIADNNLEKSIASMGKVMGPAKAELGDSVDPSSISRLAAELLKSEG